MLSLAACHRGLDNNKEAVRQGVIDYLATRQPPLNMEGMTIDLTSVKFDGPQADAVVSIAPKGGPSGSGMTIPYKLEQKGGKWVVSASVGTHPGATMPSDSTNPHGGAMPNNPHGGMTPAGGGTGTAPSPDDLPPVKKK
jgi:hypothetical protein